MRPLSKENPQMLPEIEQKIRNSFAAQSMMSTFGATLETVEKGHVEIRAPLLPGSKQQQGFAHAALMGWCFRRCERQTQSRQTCDKFSFVFVGKALNFVCNACKFYSIYLTLALIFI